MYRPFYRATYHRKDWVLADAFRPQPGWGTKVFHSRVEAVGEHTQEELLTALHEIAPEGHRLTCLEIYPADGPDRVLWSTAPDPRFADARSPQPDPEGAAHA